MWIVLDIRARVKCARGQVQTVNSPFGPDQRRSRDTRPGSLISCFPILSQPSSRAYSSSTTLSSIFLNNGAGWRSVAALAELAAFRLDCTVADHPNGTKRKAVSFRGCS